jgi:hypothetical protein
MCSLAAPGLSWISDFIARAGGTQGARQNSGAELGRELSHHAQGRRPAGQPAATSPTGSFKTIDGACAPPRSEFLLRQLWERAP